MQQKGRLFPPANASQNLLYFARLTRKTRASVEVMCWTLLQSKHPRVALLRHPPAAHVIESLIAPLDYCPPESLIYPPERVDYYRKARPRSAPLLAVKQEVTLTSPPHRLLDRVPVCCRLLNVHDAPAAIVRVRGECTRLEEGVRAS